MRRIGFKVNAGRIVYGADGGARGFPGDVLSEFEDCITRGVNGSDVTRVEVEDGLLVQGEDVTETEVEFKHEADVRLLLVQLDESRDKDSKTEGKRKSQTTASLETAVAKAQAFSATIGERAKAAASERDKAAIGAQ